jgi:hypothetical protein
VACTPPPNAFPLFSRAAPRRAQAGDGGAVFVDAFTDYVADHTIFERNEAKRGGAVFLQDFVIIGTVKSQATFFASHSLFLKNVRACVHAYGARVMRARASSL